MALAGLSDNRRVYFEMNDGKIYRQEKGYCNINMNDIRRAWVCTDSCCFADFNCLCPCKITTVNYDYGDEDRT